MAKVKEQAESLVHFASARTKVWNPDYSVPAQLDELIVRVDFAKYFDLISSFER